MIEALSADVLQTLHEVQFPVGLIDLARRVQWQNPASIALIGDVRGKLDASVVAPEDLEEARVQFARKLMGARHTEHEVTVICADGTRARMETSSCRSWLEAASSASLRWDAWTNAIRRASARPD